MDDAAAPPSIALADPLERAMAHVEARAFDAWTLGALAEVAGLSTYHFARQFNARFGLAPMAFVRARRLGLAARALAGAEPPALVDLAFDCGFGSQEGFTRAFKRAFGVSPGRYRRERIMPNPRDILAMSDATPLKRLTQEPAPVSKPAFRVAGVSAVFDESNKAGIPMLWPRLVERLPLAGQIHAGTFGVGWPTGEGEGGFRYMASVEIAEDAPVPAGLEALTIPAQTYLIFRLATDGSELHPQMQAAMREIWGERAPKSGFRLANGPDLEVYPPGFDPNRPARIEWWIPVEA
jgi:AraC family transcriptional regulator